jgi:hypothetical protein
MRCAAEYLSTIVTESDDGYDENTIQKLSAMFLRKKERLSSKKDGENVFPYWENRIFLNRFLFLLVYISKHHQASYAAKPV